jgi:hypothetical protein
MKMKIVLSGIRGSNSMRLPTSKDAIDVLIKLPWKSVKHDIRDIEMRQVIIRALGSVDQIRKYDALIRLLSEDRSDIEITAMETICNLGIPKARDKLLASASPQYSDRKLHGRAQAVASLESYQIDSL